MTRVIAVTSGKGGVGKSNFALNVGIALALMDQRVQLLDADLGLANLDVLLGVRPELTLEDAVLRDVPLRDIILHTDYHIDLIPGASGAESMADLAGADTRRLVDQVMALSAETDFLLVDTGAGISSGVVTFLMAAPEVVVGVTPDPTSLTDAYALIKVLVKNGYEGRISVFASQMDDNRQGRRVYRKLESAAQRFLQTPVSYLGSVVRDEHLRQAVGEQKPVVVRYPATDISRSYRVIATTLLGQTGISVDQEQFWSRLLRMISAAPRIPRETPPAPAAEAAETAPDLGVLTETMVELLAEQRRTRELLEQIVNYIEDRDQVPPTFLGGFRR